MEKTTERKCWFIFIMTLPILFIVSTFGAYHFLDMKLETKTNRVSSQYQLADASIKQTTELPVVFYKNGMEEDVKRQMKETHNFFNELLGWGGVSQLQFGEIDFLELTREIIRMQDGLGNCLVQEDLANVRKLLEGAEKNHDRIAMVYAHRIIHDLDIELHKDEAETGQEDTWGATISFGKRADEKTNID